jgi:signal transduction histidine kinase
MVIGNDAAMNNGSAGRGGAGGPSDTGGGARCGPRPASARDRAWAREWLRRMRLERQLHDGASLRVSALSLRLGLLRQEGSEAEFRRAVADLQDELHAVLDELRDVAGQIYPTLLDQAGLGPALCELADRAGLPVTVRAGEDRFGTAAEGAGYFAVADVLATLGPDDRVDLVVGNDDGQLTISLIGASECHADLVNDRVKALGGSVTVTSGTFVPPDTSDNTANSTITVRIPCE